MNYVYNKTGSHCNQEGIVCDFNMIDSPQKQFICFGCTKKCVEGSRWEFFIKQENRIYRKEEAKYIKDNK